MRTGIRAFIAAVAALGLLASSASATLSPNNQLTLPAGGTAKGFVIVIHGGGWQGGASYVAQEDGIAAWFNQQGYGAYNIDYTSGVYSYFDVLSAYDWLHAQYPSAPLCAWGESAGGHLALLLAASRPLNCVITQGAPTDFATFPTQPSASGLAWPQYLYSNLIVPTFQSALSAASPINYCPSIQTPILLAASAGDPYVPVQQMYEVQARCPHAQAVLLDAGPVNFTHAGVSQAAATEWVADVSTFLSQSMSASAVPMLKRALPVAVRARSACRLLRTRGRRACLRGTRHRRSGRNARGRIARTL
jgi:fermentation-respiration switch protein FrsA (DUF1100 family)